MLRNRHTGEDSTTLTLVGTVANVAAALLILRVAGTSGKTFLADQ
jgi:hypothetical protein